MPLSVPHAASKPSTHDENFEALVAGRWLNYVGILALLFAVTFFLKYAFDNDWVGPRGRVSIGLLLGSALYPWSQRLLSKGYKYFSEGIAALGAAVLYVSLWAGWHYYEIFSQSTAFALMIVVTAATFVVAVGRNSERIALLAQIGGLITPVLVSTGENHEVALFTYLLFWARPCLSLAWIRAWKSLLPVQFAATHDFFLGLVHRFLPRTGHGGHDSVRDAFLCALCRDSGSAQLARWRNFEVLEIGIVVLNAVSFPDRAA